MAGLWRVQPLVNAKKGPYSWHASVRGCPLVEGGIAFYTRKEPTPYGLQRPFGFA